LLTQRLLGDATPTTTAIYAAADPMAATPTVHGLRVHQEEPDDE